MALRIDALRIDGLRIDGLRIDELRIDDTYLYMDNMEAYLHICAMQCDFRIEEVNCVLIK